MLLGLVKDHLFLRQASSRIGAAKLNPAPSVNLLSFLTHTYCNTCCRFIITKNVDIFLLWFLSGWKFLASIDFLSSINTFEQYSPINTFTSNEWKVNIWDYLFFLSAGYPPKCVSLRSNEWKLFLLWGKLFCDHSHTDRLLDVGPAQNTAAYLKVSHHFLPCMPFFLSIIVKMEILW